MILMTGGTGMLGLSLLSIMDKDNVIGFGRQDCNLLNPKETRDFFCAVKPKVVIHAAARVGGILDNSQYPYSYFYENVLINTNVIQSCLDANVERVVAISSTCVYPSKVESYPITEKELHNGMPEITNLSYGYSKRMMQVQLEAARQQFGLKSVTLYLGNLYGPNDHFDKKSHLVASLIQKMHLAKEEGKEEIELFGTGKPLRQFTFVDDVSNVIKRILDTDIDGSWNLATPENLSVFQISKIVADVIGYSGRLVFNGKLDGQFRKDVDSSPIAYQINGIRFTSLFEGIKKTYSWYRRFKCGL